MWMWTVSKPGGLKTNGSKSERSLKWTVSKINGFKINGHWCGLSQKWTAQSLISLVKTVWNGRSKVHGLKWTGWSGPVWSGRPWVLYHRLKRTGLKWTDWSGRIKVDRSEMNGLEFYIIGKNGPVRSRQSEVDGLEFDILDIKGLVWDSHELFKIMHR